MDSILEVESLTRINKLSLNQNKDPENLTVLVMDLDDSTIATRY